MSASRDALMFARLVVLLAALAVLSLRAQEPLPVPPLTGRVVDATKTLSPGEIQQTETRLAALERDKGVQIAVLIVATTAPEDIESFGIRIAEQWKIGRKGVDDGLIVIIAKNDRAMRLEVGYGLEGVIPDAVANRLINEYFIPRFREGDWAGGLMAGFDRIAQLIEGEPLPPPKAQPLPKGESLQSLVVFFFLLVFLVGGVLRALFGRFGGATAVGGIAGIAGWMLIGSLLLAAGVGIVAFILTLFGGAGPGVRGTHGKGWPGGHGGLGGWGGGFGGGGLGGGGFRGGGGGFGGGGASGRW